MKPACQNFTSSRVTSKLIGTKLVKIKTQVPVRAINIYSQSESHLLVEMKFRYVLSMFLTIHLVPKNAPRLDRKI